MDSQNKYKLAISGTKACVGASAERVRPFALVNICQWDWKMTAGEGVCQLQWGTRREIASTRSELALKRRPPAIPTLCKSPNQCCANHGKIGIGGHYTPQKAIPSARIRPCRGYSGGTMPVPSPKGVACCASPHLSKGTNGHLNLRFGPCAPREH